MKESLDKLKAGNQRFVNGTTAYDISSINAQRVSAVKSQEPFAVILGCSDSRVPVEHVFDQGLGDLFVIRVAGNVVAPSQIGSVEFAVAMFGTPLVVVMGHSNCGAIHASLDAMKSPDKPSSLNIQAIVKRIQPAIEPLVEKAGLEQVKIADAVKSNVEKSVSQLRHGSEILEAKIAEQSLNIIGAYYDLESGVVEFYD